MHLHLLEERLHVERNRIHVMIEEEIYAAVLL